MSRAARTSRSAWFNDFFRANNANALTVVCCAMDYVWAEELAHPRYGVRFERPTTLAAGDDTCRFRFFRDASRQGVTQPVANSDAATIPDPDRHEGRFEVAGVTRTLQPHVETGASVVRSRTTQRH